MDFFQCPPFVNLKPRNNTGYPIGGMIALGSSWDILDALVAHYKFTPLLVVPPSGAQGVVNASGQWDGIMGLLQSGVSSHHF